MAGEVIVSVVLGLAAIYAAYKTGMEAIKANKEKHQESLGAAANQKVLDAIAKYQGDIDYCIEEMDKMKIRQAKQDGVIDAIFKMRKD